MMEEVLNAKELPTLRRLLEQCAKYDADGSYVFDADKARRQKEVRRRADYVSSF